MQKNLFVKRTFSATMALENCVFLSEKNFKDFVTTESGSIHIITDGGIEFTVSAKVNEKVKENEILLSNAQRIKMNVRLNETLKISKIIL